MRLVAVVLTVFRHGHGQHLIEVTFETSTLMPLSAKEITFQLISE